MKSKYAIVVVGYNRLEGFLRLLDSLENASYGDDELTLILSLDNCGDDVVENAARKFSWTHGEKIVRTFSVRQGLRNHILKCGDYLEEYDAIAVLEDDLIVSPAFYSYMKQAVTFYQNNMDIAGISLYSHRMNVNCYTPFQPAFGCGDTFFLQFAQSWGQIWLKKQWQEFRRWYEQFKSKALESDDFPIFVSNWPANSWLKYHIKYCVETNKQYVYPYVSLTTCFSDVGEHSKQTNSMYQVPLMMDTDYQYTFSNLCEEAVRYDVFFERIGLEKHLEIPENSLLTDLYGVKQSLQGKTYLLSTKRLDYKIIKRFAMAMKPHEQNIVYNISGEDIYLYMLSKHEKNKENKTLKYSSSVQYYHCIPGDYKRVFFFLYDIIKKKIGNIFK